MFVTSARNAIPATPARFMHRFSCRCMLWAGPRSIWTERGKVVHDFACRSMHAMYALLLRRRLARKRASERQSIDTKKPLVGQRLCGINEPDGRNKAAGVAAAVRD